MWIIAPEAKAAQVLSKAGKAVKLGKQVRKGGQVLIKVTESKVGKEATRLVEKAGGKVVENLMKVVELRKANKKEEAEREIYSMCGDYHRSVMALLSYARRL